MNLTAYTECLVWLNWLHYMQRFAESWSVRQLLVILRKVVWLEYAYTQSMLTLMHFIDSIDSCSQ